MGIKNLMDLIKKYSPTSIKYKKISDYKNSKIGIDINLLIYKMIYAIRLNGYDIKNGNTIVTHIHTFLQKIKGLIKYNIKPIFVFDGEMPNFKENTLKQREQIGKQLQKKYYNATTEKDKKKYYYMKSKITDREVDDIITMIKIFGYPIIFSPYEADCQLAYLQKKGLIDYVASDDMDLLVFGSNILLKDFTISDKKYICEINLTRTLKNLNVSYKQLVEIAMLMGCDYCERIFGPIKSYKLIKEYRSIKNLIKKGIIKDNNYSEIKDYFIDPPIKQTTTIKWTKNKSYVQELVGFLKKHHYDDKQINEKLILNLDIIMLH